MCAGHDALAVFFRSPIACPPSLLHIPDNERPCTLLAIPHVAADGVGLKKEGLSRSKAMQCLPYLQDQVQLPLRAQHSVSLLNLFHHSLPGIWSTPLLTNPTPGPAGYQLDFGRHKVLSFFFVRGYSFTWNVFIALCFLFLFPTCPSRSS